MTDTFPENSIKYAQELIKCPSVTPKEAGALSYLQQLLEPTGFENSSTSFHRFQHT